ncbi:unnamed protein product [Diatraea saccharalis]|uniref:Uncharacterized protein n=1 Tax=Diatraea saccharalis TaxID=40085 RepID=A0A9N9N143_9NEOP|nr:unnamed protein product [Diatraea saccharalis]
MVTRNYGGLPINKNNVVQAVTGFGRRNYAKDDKDCCKDVAQTEGKRVESWPKDDPPPPAWRCECPRDPQPPNYDPYRIKVPDIVVPPLPPSNAKWDGVALTSNPHGGQDHTQGPGSYGFDPHSGMQQQEAAKQEEGKEEGFLGILKSLFGKGRKTEGKGSGDTMMDYQYCDAEEHCAYPEYQQYSVPQPVTDLIYNSPLMCRDHWMPQPEKKEHIKESSKLGYHGRIKLKYAFHEPWKPLDRMSLLEQAEREEMGQGDEDLTKSTDKQLSK